MVEKVPISHPPIEDTLVANNQVLSIYVVNMKQVESGRDVFMYSKIIQWITSLKPR